MNGEEKEFHWGMEEEDQEEEDEEDEEHHESNGQQMTHKTTCGAAFATTCVSNAWRRRGVD
eukprot:1390669-Pyramimonas_sp.AAC.1